MTEPIAHARLTDPDTSHDAAGTVKVRRSQLEVYGLLSMGPGTDSDVYDRAVLNGIRISASGCRTRRAELVRMGYVRDTGVRVFLLSGRRSIVWEVNPEAAFPFTEQAA